jgi:hypothetical protein
MGFSFRLPHHRMRRYPPFQAGIGDKARPFGSASTSTPNPKILDKDRSMNLGISSDPSLALISETRIR